MTNTWKWAALIYVALIGLLLQIGFTDRRHRDDYTPVPLPAQSRNTEQSLQDAIVAMNHRTTLAVYEQSGKCSPAWNAAAREVIEAFNRVNSEFPDHPAFSSILDPARAVIDKGCHDPLLLYIYGKALFETQNFGATQNYQAAIPYLREAMDGFAASKYPKILTRHAPDLLAQCLEKTGQQDGLSKTRQQALAWTVDALTDGSIKPGEEPIILDTQESLDQIYSAPLPELLDALKARKLETLYVSRVLEGRYHISMGWEARGHVSAKQVTPNGWKIYHKNMAEAEAILVPAWKAHPEFYEAPEEMITVAMGRREAGSTRMWFDRTVAARFDEMSAYDAYAKSINPYWYGSCDAMYKFGLECLRTNRFDTQVPFYLWIMHDSIRDIDHQAWSRLNVYPQLKVMFSGYAKQHVIGHLDWKRYLHVAAGWRYRDELGAKDIILAYGMKVDADYQQAQSAGDTH